MKLSSKDFLEATGMTEEEWITAYARDALDRASKEAVTGVQIKESGGKTALKVDYCPHNLLGKVGKYPIKYDYDYCIETG